MLRIHLQGSSISHQSQPVLNRGEVESLFSHPLKPFLTSDSSMLHEPLSEEIPYHTYTDIPWTRGDKKRNIRMHRFLTGREAGGIKPVFGLTACVPSSSWQSSIEISSHKFSSILIRVASIGYGRPPDFEVKAPGQPTVRERIDYALRHDPRFIEAYEEEDDIRRKDSGIVREFLKRAPRLQLRRRRIRSHL